MLLPKKTEVKHFEVKDGFNQIIVGTGKLNLSQYLHKI